MPRRKPARTAFAAGFAAAFTAMLSQAASAAPPASPRLYPADLIGHVTRDQLRAAAPDGLPVGALSARQRQSLPTTAASTRVKFFKRDGGRYGVLLLAPPSAEEMKAPQVGTAASPR